MKDIKIIPLIPDWTENSLSRYFQDVAKIPPLSADEEKRLFEKKETGDERAFNKLVESNLRFVITVAKQYQNNGVSLPDLIQEGNLALIQAVKKYDSSAGVKFISYAVWWIRQAIIKTICDHCRTVRLPINKINIAHKLIKESEKFEQVNQRQPSPFELSEALSIGQEDINLIIGGYYKNVCLETPINNTQTIYDTLQSNDAEYNDTHVVSQILKKIFDKLPQRNRDIISMSFGIGQKQLSKKEIGKRFGICEERVRQIQNKTLAHIKKHHAKELSDLLLFFNE